VIKKNMEFYYVLREIWSSKWRNRIP
jgi:hypothetical protein